MTSNLQVSSISLAVPDVGAYTSFYQSLFKLPTQQAADKTSMELVPGTTLHVSAWKAKNEDDEYTIGQVYPPHMQVVFRAK